MRCLAKRLLIPALALLATAPAWAEPWSDEIGGAAFPRSVRVEGVPLELHAVGLLRWFFLTGYAAGLYLSPGAGPDAALADAPKRLEIHYFHAIDGEDFGPAAWQVLARSLDEPELARVRERAERMAAAYQDVKPGDRYSLTYLPGVGTRLALNGEPKVTVPGADFARAYFGIWLGPHPIDESLRDQLLQRTRALVR